MTTRTFKDKADLSLSQWTANAKFDLSDLEEDGDDVDRQIQPTIAKRKKLEADERRIQERDPTYPLVRLMEKSSNLLRHVKLRSQAFKPELTEDTVMQS